MTQYAHFAFLLNAMHLKFDWRRLHELHNKMFIQCSIVKIVAQKPYRSRTLLFLLCSIIIGRLVFRALRLFPLCSLKPFDSQQDERTKRCDWLSCLGKRTQQRLHTEAMGVFIANLSYAHSPFHFVSLRQQRGVDQLEMCCCRFVRLRFGRSTATHEHSLQMRFLHCFILVKKE